jgi:hypothetical protein
MPLVVRRVVEPSELLVAELLVEAGRLKAECVDPSGVTAAVARAGFRPNHELAVDPATAQPLGDPQIFYEEPSAVRLAGQTRNNLSPVSDKNSERSPRRVLRPLPFVERFQPVGKNLDIRFGRIVFDREPIPRTQPERRTNCSSEQPITVRGAAKTCN